MGIICHRANMAARELKAKTKAKATYGSGAHVAETLFVQVAHHKASNKRTASYRARLVHVLRLKRACTKALHARSFAVSTSRRNRARARAERANKARVIKRLNAKAAAKKKL